MKPINDMFFEIMEVNDMGRQKIFLYDNLRRPDAAGQFVYKSTYDALGRIENDTLAGVLTGYEYVTTGK